MTDTQESKGQVDQPSQAPVEQEEESAWPSWLSWVLVIAAGVFGGYLLGAKGGGSQGAGVSQAMMERRLREQIDLLKAQQVMALEMGQRVNDDRMRAFYREVIRTGLFRDGLEEAFAELGGKLKSVSDLLSTPSTTKPEDRIGQAAARLKEIQSGLGQLAEKYGKHSEALKRVGEIGNTDQNILALSKQIAYLYYDRTKQLMREFSTETQDAMRQAALRQAGFCRAMTAQLDPKMAAELDKQFPQLAAQSGTASTTAPAGQ
jgi:hypothetical protein